MTHNFRTMWEKTFGKNASSCIVKFQDFARFP